jgi:hypothetical protein
MTCWDCMPSQLRVIATAAFGSLLILGVSGCQFSYPFEISGVIRRADGDPLPGVSVTLKAQSIRESSFPVVTGTDGTFKARVRIGDIEFMGRLPKWSLELSKEGYEAGTVDVSPKQRPESPRKTTLINAVGTLKVK